MVSVRRLRDGANCIRLDQHLCRYIGNLIKKH